jgi:transposase
MKYNTMIAVDLAKSIFEIAVSNAAGQLDKYRRLSRARFERFFAQSRPATVILEACSSAHHWARVLQNLGHSVILLPPHAVRPYVVGNKTDRADAKGLLEAFRNKDIMPVPVKSPDQHVLAALHRLRSAYLSSRTARINTIRGILRELGITIPTGATRVVPAVRVLIQELDPGIPKALHPALAGAADEILELETRIRHIEHQLEALSRDNLVITQLRSIPGVGLLSATALVAFVGNVNRFPTGRHFASFLGLTPREHSSGFKRRLGRISKRGDAYLRMLLIHGARSVICHAKRSKSHDRLRAWALRIEKERGHNKAAVALANKLARITWAVWRNGENFMPFERGN